MATAPLLLLDGGIGVGLTVGEASAARIDAVAVGKVVGVEEEGGVTGVEKEEGKKSCILEWERLEDNEEAKEVLEVTLEVEVTPMVVKARGWPTKCTVPFPDLQSQASWLRSL